jgi:hypothetical protein
MSSKTLSHKKPGQQSEVSVQYLLHALTDTDIVKVAMTAMTKEKRMVGYDTGSINVGGQSRKTAALDLDILACQRFASRPQI